MKKELIVIYDDEAESKISVNGENGFKDPMMDLKILLEGAALLANVCRTNLIEEFEGQRLADYMKSYVDKALLDYKPAPHSQESVQ